MPKQKYAEYIRPMLCLGQIYYANIICQDQAKTYENIHRANLVHDCIDVIKIYDINLFDKHWLMQS